ncbi:MAG: glycosyltransferase family 4 protein [Anaerolineae bacterium]|nr:glycosyltransferase family 4 protein [Thermoflexales bacterium]MDW8407492.1 glycosyltransferase family 4 protein [Anaerolineae bacterium]
MRILFVPHAYYPSRGGVQWLIQSLAERLAWAGDQIDVFTTDAYSCELFIDACQPRLPAGEITLNGVRVRRFPVFNRFTRLRLNAARIAYKLRLPGQDVVRGLYFGPIVRGLRQAIVNQPADVIVAASFPMIHMYEALAAGRLSGRPVIFIGTVHPTDRWSYDLPRMYHAIEQAQAYVALSTYERDFLAARCAGARIEVIGGGVDTHALDARQAGVSLRRRYGWRDDELVIGMIGRMTAYKRADVMLAAMPLIWQALPTARLLLAGAGAQQAASLRAAIQSLSHPERVSVLADFDETDKAAIFSTADLIVHLSDRESFGIVIVEGWAAGKPVIGVQNSASASVITDGEDGLLVRYGDPADLAHAVVKLGSSSELRQALGYAGQLKARHLYDWNVVVPRYRALFSALTEGKRG